MQNLDTKKEISIPKRRLRPPRCHKKDISIPKKDAPIFNPQKKIKKWKIRERSLRFRLRFGSWATLLHLTLLIQRPMTRPTLTPTMLCRLWRQRVLYAPETPSDNGVFFQRRSASVNKDTVRTKIIADPETFFPGINFREITGFYCGKGSVWNELRWLIVSSNFQALLFLKDK